jgi:hypothetical protein
MQFTPSSVQEAKNDYKKLLEGFKNLDKKSSKKMQAISMEAWADLKSKRDIKAELGGSSNKRHKTL